MADWDMRKVINNPDRLAEFDDFATYFFETFTSHIKNEHDKRKGNGQGPVTQFMFLVDVENYSYMQLINFKGKKVILEDCYSNKNDFDCLLSLCSYQQNITIGGKTF